MDKKIENLFTFIESTAQSIKILSETELPIVKDILEGKENEGDMPSVASAAEFQLRGIKGRVGEITELLNSLEQEIFKQYSGK